MLTMFIHWYSRFLQRNREAIYKETWREQMKVIEEWRQTL